eukprot:5543884-Prymnesium_polylepis.1
MWAAHGDEHIEREAEEVVDSRLLRVGHILGAQCRHARLKRADASLEQEERRKLHRDCGRQDGRCSSGCDGPQRPHEVAHGGRHAAT